MTCRLTVLTVPRRYFFCGSFMFLFCLVFAMFCANLFICALWSPAGKGLTSWLSFVVSSVSLSLSLWYPGSGVVLDCIDSWSLHLSYFYKCMKFLWNIPDGYQIIFCDGQTHEQTQGGKQKCKSYGSCAWHVVWMCAKKVWRFVEIPLMVIQL